MSRIQYHPFRGRVVRTVAAAIATSGLLISGATAASAAVGSHESLTGSLDAGSVFLGLQEETLQGRLASVPNFRDAAGDAGDGYSTSGEKRMQQGMFYRADNLAALSIEDEQALTELGIVTIYDLRTTKEVESAPNILPAGAKYLHLPISAGATELKDFVQMTDPEQGREFMRDMNRSFVEDPTARAQFSTMLTDMATSEGPFLYHCTSGKDRTGWTSMLLQHIAGASDETIMRDYLMTNDYIAHTVVPTLDRIADAGLNPEIFRPMIQVEASFLQAGLDAAKSKYGDLDTYLTDGLGLDQATIAALEEKLLA